MYDLMNYNGPGDILAKYEAPSISSFRAEIKIS